MAASFSSVGKDALSVVARQLGTRDLIRGLGVNRAFRSVVQRAPNYLPLQKLQWGPLLGSLWRNDFNANEGILREFGLSTVEFTAAEEEAWRQAWASLDNPPPPSEEVAPAAVGVPMAAVDYGRGRQRLPLPASVDPVKSVNPTAPALREASFEQALRTFATDGRRSQPNPYGSLISIATNLHLRSGTSNSNTWRSSRSHTGLILILVTAHELRTEGARFHTAAPVVIQLLSMSGFDFERDTRHSPHLIGIVFRGLDLAASSREAVRLSASEIFLSAQIIFDRLLVQRSLIVPNLIQRVSTTLHSLEANSVSSYRALGGMSIVPTIRKFLLAAIEFSEHVRYHEVDDQELGKRASALLQRLP